MRTAAAVAALLAACGWVRADRVIYLTTDGKAEMPPLENVIVVEVKEGQLVYKLGGNALSKDLKNVSLIRIEGQTAFNDAEAKMRAGKAAEAVAAYDEAAKDAPKPPVSQLLPLRRLRAAKQAKITDRAVADWLKIMDDNNASKEAVALAPGNEHFGARGSTQNAKASSILEAKLKELKDRKEYATEVKQLLRKLYEADGQDEKAALLAKEIAGLTEEPAGNGNTGSEAPLPRARLDATRDVIDKGQATAENLEGIVKHFAAARKKYRAEDLPLALLVVGRAQMVLYEKGDKKDKGPLAQAGLNLMRVHAHFPDSKEAPEALFYAGQVNLALGNRNGARLAYEAVTRSYGRSEMAAKAAAALEALKNLKETP